MMKTNLSANEQATPAAVTIPRWPLVADIQPMAGPAWVRAQLDDGTLLPVAELCGPSDWKIAYGTLFTASLDMHAELLNQENRWEAMLEHAVRLEDFGMEHSCRNALLHVRQTLAKAQA